MATVDTSGKHNDLREDLKEMIERLDMPILRAANEMTMSDSCIHSFFKGHNISSYTEKRMRNWIESKKAQASVVEDPRQAMPQEYFDRYGNRVFPNGTMPVVSSRPILSDKKVKCIKLGGDTLRITIEKFIGDVKL